MSKSRSWPEPSPEHTSTHLSQWSWNLYKYGFAVLFIVNSLWALYILVNGRKKISKNVHAFVMNVLLLLMGCLRAGLLFRDPYLSPSKTTASFILELIVFGVGSACSVSAFTILLLILLETTNVRFGAERFKKLRYPLIVTFLYVVLFVSSDVVVVYYPQAKIMLLFCQVIYVIWGAMVCIGFALTARKIWQNLRPSRNMAYYNNQFKKEVERMKILVLLLSMASLAGGIAFILKMFAVISSDFSVFSEKKHVSYWSWYGLTCATLTTELMINILIYTIALRTYLRRPRPNRVPLVLVRSPLAVASARRG